MGGTFEMTSKPTNTAKTRIAKLAISKSDEGCVSVATSWVYSVAFVCGSRADGERTAFCFVVSLVAAGAVWSVRLVLDSGKGSAATTRPISANQGAQTNRMVRSRLQCFMTGISCVS